MEKSAQRFGILSSARLDFGTVLSLRLIESEAINIYDA